MSQQTEELRKLLSEATPGKWSCDGNSIETDDYTVRDPIDPEVSCGAYCLGGTAQLNLSEADGKLIAAMKNSMEDLLDELESFVKSDICMDCGNLAISTCRTRKHHIRSFYEKAAK